ncbi:3561_t:CDS:2 [Ambispora gerdemannii]|uniref:3561_t:CDS:1 n=1 Tax=Ambispora gerdemannii TaxID=144530 RepID=A0A9N9F2G8_9GLOM|nr:3561_t:CDS:2 [Ambispora gerdemannii]
MRSLVWNLRHNPVLRKRAMQTDEQQCENQRIQLENLHTSIKKPEPTAVRYDNGDLYKPSGIIGGNGVDADSNWFGKTRIISLNSMIEKHILITLPHSPLVTLSVVLYQPLPTTTTNSTQKSALLLTSYKYEYQRGLIPLYKDIMNGLTAAGISCVQMRFTSKPENLEYCIQDILEVIEKVKRDYGIEKFVIAGWSFAGAIVLRIAASKRSRLIYGCVTLGIQSTEPISMETMRKISPLPILIIHGYRDNQADIRISKELYCNALAPKGIYLPFSVDHQFIVKENTTKKIVNFCKNAFD